MDTRVFLARERLLILVGITRVNITDGSGNFIATTRLSGFGIAATTGAPVAQLSTNYLPFGTIPVGTTKSLPVMATNIGGGTLTVVPFVNGTHDYAITDSTCAAGVTPGNSCTLVLQFAPTTPEKHDGILLINGGSPIVGLEGFATGLSVLGLRSGSPLDFEIVSSGSTETKLLTVANVGLPGTVTVGTTISGHSYSVLTTSENTCQAGLAEGQSCILPVQFAPTKSGLHDDLLTLTPSPGGGSTTVWLTGSTP